MDYHSHLKDSTAKSDKMTKTHKNVSDSYIKISSELIQLATIDTNELEKFLTKASDALEKARVSNKGKGNPILSIFFLVAYFIFLWENVLLTLVLIS